MMALLHIATPGSGPAPLVGRLPGNGPEYRLVLDPSASLADAVAAVTAGLRDHRTAWVSVGGRSAAPFLSAVAADLALAVAGALIFDPARWDPARPLDLSPLPFPSALLVDAGGPRVARGLAAAWGATLLSARRPGPVLAEPRVIDLIHRRERSLAAV